MKKTISKELNRELSQVSFYKKNTINTRFSNCTEIVQLNFLYGQKRRLRLFNVLPEFKNSIGVKKHFFTPGQFTKIIDGTQSYSQRIFGSNYLSVRNLVYFFKTTRLSVFFSKDTALKFLVDGMFRTKALPLYILKIYNFPRKVIYLLSKKFFLTNFNKKFIVTNFLSSLKQTSLNIQISLLIFLRTRFILGFFLLLHKFSFKLN